MRTTNEIALTKTIEVDCPRDIVWKLWTTESGCKLFFAPKCKVDFRIGGAYEMYFLNDHEAGERGSEGCTILSYLPETMLSFTWNAPPDFPEIRKEGPTTWVVVELEELAPARTKITLTHLGWKKGGNWPRLYGYFDKAWEKVLEWLKDECDR